MAIVASAPSLNDFQLRIVDTFRYDYGHPQLDEKIIQYAPNETPSSGAVPVTCWCMIYN